MGSCENSIREPADRRGVVVSQIIVRIPLTHALHDVSFQCSETNTRKGNNMTITTLDLAADSMKAEMIRGSRDEQIECQCGKDAQTGSCYCQACEEEIED